MSIPRDITEKAKKYLDSREILLFIGARQAGKTTVLKQLQEHIQARNASTFYLNLEDPDYLKLLNQSPKNLFRLLTINLAKKSFLFMDEIQYLDNPSNFLKYFYDEYAGKIKFLVSGSSAFYIDRKFKDSLAGRKKIFHVHTLSFREFLRFKGEEKLSRLDFFKLSLSEQEQIDVSYHEFMLFGGYPRVVLAPFDEKKDLLQEIAFSYIKKDILEAGVRKDEVFYKLFKLLAAQAGNLVNTSELANTIGVSKTAVDHYLYVMQRSFHLVLIKPFSGNVRKELTKMPKIYFLDLGLRNFFLNDFSPFERRLDQGALLENAAFRQLAERVDEDEIRFWRTIQQHEVDFIVKREFAVEVKVDVRSFQEKKYQPFMDSYPDIPLQLATLHAREDRIGKFPVKEIWQL